MSDLFKTLAAPFPADKVSWRVGPTTTDKGRGMALAYIDARDVMERLDAACGPAGWQCEYVPMPDGTNCCRIAVKCGDEWVWKANGGSNVAESEKPDAQEMAAKGGYSDAFKRAAVVWGIGRYLYDVASPWVEIEAAGRSFKIPDRELARLRQMLSNGVPRTATAPAAAEPTPPAPQPVHPPTESEKRMFAQLTLDINGLQTTDEMNAWRQKPENVTAFKALPPALRGDLQRTMTLHHETLAGLKP